MKAKKKISAGKDRDSKPAKKTVSKKKKEAKKQIQKKAERENGLSDQKVEKKKKSRKKTTLQKPEKAVSGILSAVTSENTTVDEKKGIKEGLNFEEKRSILTTVARTKEQTAIKDEVEIEDIEIPPILLEGDTPAPVDPKWISEKYALGPGAIKQHFSYEEESFDLPEAYGTGELIVTARDPYWIYAAWDLTLKQIRHYNQLSSCGNMTLRVFSNKIEGAPRKEIQVYPHSRDWFINVEEPGQNYIVVLGYYNKNGAFVNVVASLPIKTPPPVEIKKAPSEAPTEQKLTQQKYIAPATIEGIREESFIFSDGAEKYPTEEVHPGVASDNLSKESQTALTAEESAHLIQMSLPFVQRSSFEMAGRVKEQKEEKKIALLPSSFEIGISSPAGREQQAEKKFWFNVQAEIIIYGATEPDAVVEIGGEKIQLRSDGTFTLRFALPDGFFKLPAVAKSADNKEMRQVNLEFSRKTTVISGKVGECPYISPQMPIVKENK